MKLLDTIKNKFNEMFPNDSDPKKTLVPVSVLMEDGTVETYPPTFVITDGENCFVSDYLTRYHTNMDCKYVQDDARTGHTFKAMKLHDAQHKGFDYCYECQKMDSTTWGGDDE